ncbi:hypothetical protein AC480_02695 [miscellaneous Crenarchaeota group archaeon SMTZ1-55]|nr:MAG: hypothetical protein AC480_02695 [miscellaneous Crenarchaeota group archaeon SMTZ1-55]
MADAPYDVQHGLAEKRVGHQRLDRSVRKSRFLKDVVDEGASDVLHGSAAQTRGAASVMYATKAVYRRG